MAASVPSRPQPSYQAGCREQSARLDTPPLPSADPEQRHTAFQGRYETRPAFADPSTAAPSARSPQSRHPAHAASGSPEPSHSEPEHDRHSDPPLHSSPEPSLRPDRP